MILVSLSSLNLEFLTYPPAPITHQTQGSLGSNPTALSHQCHFTSSAWSFHWSEFSPSLWFHVIVCTCCCSWHSAPCNRNCLHVPSPKYPAPLLCLPQFTPTAPAVCLGTWSPWPLPQVTQEGPRRSGAQWWWLPGRSVLLFRAVCQPWAMCRRSTRSELYVCLTTYFKRKTMKNDHESLLQTVKATICLLWFRRPCPSCLHASKIWAAALALDFSKGDARKICTAFTRHKPSRDFNEVGTGWKGKIWNRNFETGSNWWLRSFAYRQ